MSDIAVAMENIKKLKAETEAKILAAVQEFSDSTGFKVNSNISLSRVQVFGPCDDYNYIDVKIEVSL